MLIFLLEYPSRDKSIITIRMPGRENICEISGLFGELKTQGEEQTIIDRKSCGTVYDSF